jgi:spermidine synthase
MQNATHRIIHKEFMGNHLVEVRDSATQRSLYFDSQYLQSAMSLLRPEELILSYTRFMLLGLLINPQPRNILIVGLGSGSFVRFFNHYFPECGIDAVDYSQHVIDLAKGYFQLPEGRNIHIWCTDGDVFIKEHTGPKKYDLILVDAFDAQGMAPTVYSESFITSAREKLTAEGSISFNLWTNDKKQFGAIKRILSRTFTGCLLLPVPDRGNVVALTMNCGVPWDRIDNSAKNTKMLSNRLHLDFKQLIRIAKLNNHSLKGRLKALFS